MKKNRVISYTMWKGEKIYIDSTTSLAASLVDYFTSGPQEDGPAIEAKRPTISFELTYQTDAEYNLNWLHGNTLEQTEESTEIDTSASNDNSSQQNKGNQSPRPGRTRKDDINELVRREIQNGKHCLWSYMMKKAKIVTIKPVFVTFGLLALTTAIAIGWKHRDLSRRGWTGR